MTKEETVNILNDVTQKEQGVSFLDLLHNWHKGNSMFATDIQRIVCKAMEQTRHPKQGEGEEKAIISIKQSDITKSKFNSYEIFYRLNEDYIWCICWNEYLDKKETYMDWYIEVPITEI